MPGLGIFYCEIARWLCSPLQEGPESTKAKPRDLPVILSKITTDVTAPAWRSDREDERQLPRNENVTARFIGSGLGQRRRNGEFFIDRARRSAAGNPLFEIARWWKCSRAFQSGHLSRSGGSRNPACRSKVSPGSQV